MAKYGMIWLYVMLHSIVVCGQSYTDSIELSIKNRIIEEYDIDTIIGEPYFITSDKINFNNDGYPDFFMILGEMGHETAFLYNGFTGEQFPDVYFVTRPNVSFRYEIKDVVCSDDQQELIIRYGMGGTYCHCFEMAIWRYNPVFNTADIIFSNAISEFYNDEDVQDSIRYIDVNYMDHCSDTIKVSNGKLYDESNSETYNLNITQIGSPYKIYVFDRSTNRFIILEN